MNVERIHNGIAWDETTKDYAVALGGEVLGHFPTHLQALRALENGTGHTLGAPSAPGTRSRLHKGHTAPSGQEPESETYGSPEEGQAVPHWSDVTALKAGRVDPPETMRQARRWDTANVRYTRAGLCTMCASQAAWAGQIGYSRVHPPCEECAPVVAEFQERSMSTAGAHGLR